MKNQLSPPRPSIWTFTRVVATCVLTLFVSSHLLGQSETQIAPQVLEPAPAQSATTKLMLQKIAQAEPNLLPYAPAPTVEICGNGIDDDGDGWIDGQDGDCSGMVPFDCDGKLYQTINPQNVWGFYGVETNPVTFSLISQLTGQFPSFPGINSIAFNPVDRYIYGINPNTPHQMYRLDANGTLQFMGNVSGLINNSFAGTMDFNGNYYVTGNHGRIYLIDIFTRTSTLIGSSGLNTADIAYSPDDGQLYCWNSPSRRLFKINPTNAVATAVGPSDSRFGGFGALYFNAQGDILAYGDNTTITTSSQETLVKIDPNTGVATILGTGPNVGGNDGCSCSFGLEMTKEASVATAAAGQTFSYTFTLFNAGFAALNGMDFIDALPAGLTFASEPYAATGLTIGATSITGSNSATFVVDGLAARTSGSFIIDVTVDSNLGCSGAILPNQAILSNLPAFFGSDVLSDDPNTAAVTDPTIVTVPSDAVPPSISCASDQMVECDASTSPSATGSATATDNCGNATVAFSDSTATGTCPQAYTIYRTWTATDQAGNTASCVQVIDVSDNTAPIIATCPANASVLCIADVPPSNLGQISGSDNCDPSPVAALAQESDNGGSGCAGDPLVITRNYTLTDACGNSSNCTQTITVEALPISVSGVVTDVTCFGANDGAIDLSATASCGALTFAWSNGATTEDLSGLAGGSYSVTVISSGCSATASFTIVENSPLIVDAGANAVVFPLWQDSSCAVLTGTATGGSGSYTYQWTSGSPSGPVVGTTASITVCPTATTTYYFTAIDPLGCTALDSAIVCPIDITCTDRSNNGQGGNGQSGNGVNQNGNAQLHVAICHVPPGNAANAMTKCIPITAAPQHINQHAGDYLGACGNARNCDFGSNKMAGSKGSAFTSEGSINAYPNPFGEKTSVKVLFQTNELATMQVYDAKGYMIQRLDLGELASDHATQVELGNSAWAKGLYLIEVRTKSGKVLTTKIIRR